MSRTSLTAPDRRLSRTLLATVVAASLPGTALAEAGRVTFAYGAANAVNKAGVERALARGVAIEAGDTIVTQGRGRVQVRFTDGSFVSLKPDTEFRVDEYSYKGQGDAQERGFFSLLKGGLRTITGFIGRARKERYRMRTPVATIGIRGTEYNLDLVTTDDQTLELNWNVADDGESAIIVTLEVGGKTKTFSFGGSGKASRRAFEETLLALEQLAAEGRIDAVSEEQIDEIFSAGDDVDNEGRALSLVDALIGATRPPPPDCTAPPGCAIVGAFGIGMDDGYGGLNVDAGTQVFDPNGVPAGQSSAIFDDDDGLLSFQGDLLFQKGGPFFKTGQRGTAQAVVDGSAFFSVDPANPTNPLAVGIWGRWVAPPGANGQTGGDFPHPATLRQGSMDTYAWGVSIPTAVPYQQGLATYTVAGFTPPAAVGDMAGALGAPGAVTGTLNANFGANSVGVNMNVGFANGSYTATGNLGLSNNPYFAGNLSVSGTGVACQGSCFGDARGNLFGPQSDGAMVGYKFNDNALSSYVTGVAAFQQQSCSNCSTSAPPRVN